MSSYVATARIASVRPHLRALEAVAEGMPIWSLPTITAGDPSATVAPPVRIGPVIDPIDDDPSTWLERVSTSWGQLTWYLFNREGWR
jgi:hypothetical protein